MARKITKSEKSAKQTAFLEALASGAMVKDAAAAAGIPQSSAYDWRKSDAAFAEAWADAYRIGTDMLEAEAQRRAVRGTKRPVFHLGKICGHVIEYSDTLLIFLMKARDPHRFDDREFYDMFARDRSTWPIPIESVRPSNAVAPFDAWRAQDHRTSY